MGIEKHVVLVSRRWDTKQIAIDVTSDGIAIGMSLDDFLAALVTEIGNPATMLTTAQLAKRVTAAASIVVQGMKDETARVM